MEHLGLISGVSIGLVVSLSAPILVWALVVTGLREVAKKNACAEQQSTAKPRKAGA
jgi:tetrahydromethanopterin S-methyltransferase subunit C